MITSSNHTSSHTSDLHLSTPVFTDLDYALQGVLECLLDDYVPTLDEPVVRIEFQQSRGDLGGVPAADLPELLYRLAHQRLTDLADRAPSIAGVRA